MSEEPSDEERQDDAMTADRWRDAVKNMHEVLTATEAAIVLRMTPKTVRSLAGKGHIDGASRLGKEWRFSKAKLLAQLQITDPAHDSEPGESPQQ